MSLLKSFFGKKRRKTNTDSGTRQNRTRKADLQGSSQKRVAPVSSEKMDVQRNGLSLLVNSPSGDLDASGPWEVGQTVDERYEVKEILGHGGMGIVYRVHHTGWDIDLAVKGVQEGHRTNKEVVEGFLHEADRWIHLGLHPNVVSAHYVRKYGDAHYIFLEYVRGMSLRQLLDSGTKLSWEQKLDIAIQICRGLQHCHSKGMLHRDIKPENVLVVPGETGDLIDTKITDFGLVRQQAAQLTGAEEDTGSVGKSLRGYGTPGYIAPELEDNPDTASEASDVYALGITLYELFTGRHPLGQHAPKGWEHIRQRREIGIEKTKLPTQPAELVQNCLHELPKKRPELKLLTDSLVGECEGGYARPEAKEAELLADALNNQALSYMDLGKHNEAADLLKAALSSDPQHIDASYNYGLIRWREGAITDDDLCSHIRVLASRNEKDEARVDWCLKEIDTERGHFNPQTTYPDYRGFQSQSAFDSQGAIGTRGRLSKSSFRHESPVRVISASSVKQFLISGDAFGVLRVWDIRTGECLQCIKAYADTITGICVTHNGRYAVTSSMDKVVKLWQLPQAAEIAEMGPLNGLVTALSLTKDDTCVLAATQKGYIYRWKLHDDPASIEVLCEERHEISSLSIDPTGKRFILGTVSRELFVKDLESGKTETTVKHVDRLPSSSGITLSHSLFHITAASGMLTGLREIGRRVGDGVTSCFGPDGRSVLSGWRDGTIKCWLLEQTSRYADTCPPSLRGHAGPISAIRFSSDGKTAFSAGADRTIRQYQLRGDERRVLFTYHGHTDVVNDLYMLDGGRQFLSAGEDGNVFLWEAISLESCEPASFAISRPVASITAVGTEILYQKYLSKFWSAMRMNDFTGALSTVRRMRTMHGRERQIGTIHCWRSLYAHLARVSFRDGWQLAQIQPPPADTSFATFIDNPIIVREKLSHIIGKTVMPKHWSVQDQGGLDQETFNGVMGLWIDSYGDTLLAAYADGQVYVYRTHEKQTLYSTLISEIGSRILCLAANGTDRIYLGQRNGGMLRVATSERQKLHERDGHSDDVTCLSLSQDGTFLASGSSDGMVKLWNAKTDRCIKTLEAECGDINSVAIVSGIAETVVSAGEDGVIAWDVNAGSRWKVREEHEAEVSCVAACPGGKWILLGDAEGAVEIWDVAKKHRIAGLAASSAAVTAVSFVDQNYGVFGTTEGTVGLLRLNPIKCIKIFRCHTDWVSALTGSKDGGLVFSGGYDGRICVTFLDWQLDVSEEGTE